MHTNTAAAAFPASEEQRLTSLNDYALLDSASEGLFDSLASLAADLCAVPISLITLIDRDRQWFKAAVGLDGRREIARDLTFCAHTILSEGITEIPDALLDSRFVGNPMVQNAPNVRFYAGVPLTVADGHAIGTLCVLDRVPRTLSLVQRGALQSIAASIVDQFELRRVRLRLLDRSAAEFYEIDAQTQRLHFVSDGTRRKLGYSLDEAQALLLGDVMPELTATGEFARCLRDLRVGKTGAVALHTMVRPKTGTAYPIALRLELLVRGGHESVVGLGVDASELTAARERNEMLAAGIDEAQNAIMIATPSDAMANGGTIVYANEAFLRATRATREALVGRTPELFVGPKTDRERLAAMHRNLSQGRNASAQYVAYRLDGSEYHCETTARVLTGDHGAVNHYVYVQRDVSDAVTREIALELLNERLTTLTEIARNVFASLDPRTLVDVLVRGVADLTGGGTAQVLARGTGGEFIRTRDLSSQAETTAGDPFIRSAAAHEGVLLDLDGRRAGVPVRARSGIVSYLLDIRAGDRGFVATDAYAFELLGQYLAVAIHNVELYGELASRRAAVIELNEVKNDLITMLAHDFKGPLTTIVGLADVLAEDDRFDAESRQFLAMINSSAMRLASLATDTLALSRLEHHEESLRFDRVDMVALLRDIVRVLGVRRRIEMHSAADAFIVRADGSRLRQVFENVIGNAIKYSPHGEPVDVSLNKQDGGIEVIVHDGGIGVPAADLSKLFERFARGSNARDLGIGGTGFGLYLARTIVDMHGGNISVESKEGQGSTFRVFVPTVPAPQRTLDRRVLLLDSEDDGRSFIAYTLRDEGYTVHSIADEIELLHALDSSRYDAAIVDVDRLVISAAELLDRIAHRTTLVRLVSTIESESTGWNAALRKPFLIKDLQVVLESAVAERRRKPRSIQSET